MPTITCTKHRTGGEDTYVAQAASTRNYGTSLELQVKNGASVIMRSLLLAGLGKAATASGGIISATLNLKFKAAAPGANTLRAAGLASAFVYNRSTYNYKNPALSGTYYTTAAISNAQTGWVALDVASIIAAVAAGTISWYGIGLQMDTADSKLFRFCSMNDPVVANRPYIQIEYSLAPSIPVTCSPSADMAVDRLTPRLSWLFSDPDGKEDTQSAYQVIVYADDGTTVEQDSGVVVSANPYYDVTAGASLAWATYYKWKVRVRDNHNIWSAYSAQFRFLTNQKPVVAITAPAGSSVDSTTPTITWSYSDPESNPQSWYWLTLAKLMADGSYLTLYSTGRVSSTETSKQIPAGYITNEVDTYRIILRVSDAVTRAAASNSLPYVEVTKNVTLVLTAGTNPVATIDVTQPLANTPGAKIDWTRTGDPDEWQIWRRRDDLTDWELVTTLADGTLRTYTDYTCGRDKLYHYQVWAVVAGKPSASNPEDTITLVFTPYWLVSTSTPALNCPLPYYRDGGGLDAELKERSAQFWPLGRRDAVQITQDIGGFDGSFKDKIVGTDSLTAFEIYHRLLKLKALKEPLYLLGFWQSWKIEISKVKYSQRTDYRGTWDISFDFTQTGGYDVPA